MTKFYHPNAIARSAFECGIDMQSTLGDIDQWVRVNHPDIQAPDMMAEMIRIELTINIEKWLDEPYNGRLGAFTRREFKAEMAKSFAEGGSK